MPAWVTGTAAKVIGGAALLLILAGATVYITRTLHQGGRDAERADTNAKAIKTEERMKDADASGPRTPAAVDKRLRDGSF
jgi:hypothetical protein